MLIWRRRIIQRNRKTIWKQPEKLLLIQRIVQNQVVKKNANRYNISDDKTLQEVRIMGKKNRDKKKSTKEQGLKDINVNTETQKRTITPDLDKIEK